MKTSIPTFPFDDLPYFDAHCDTLTAADGRYGELCLELGSESYTRRAQVFAICGDISPRPMDKLFGDCIRRISSVKGAVLCRDRETFVKTEKSGKCAGILAVEGGEVLDCDPAELERAFSLGVRIIAPTWNVYNGLCGTSSELSDRGLTRKGRDFCREAVSLGMFIDVSHASDRAAFDAVSLFGDRVLASHSNSRSICPHRRNLSDELFLAITGAGGCVGINLYSPFVSENDPTVEKVADHIEHFAALSPFGTDRICLGCDLDGCDSLPCGIAKSADVSLIAGELLRRGFDRGSIIDIFHDNLFGFVWERQEA